MHTYIDGFVFPIPKAHIETYQAAAAQVAEIWKEYGAISYNEFVGNDLSLEGTKSFVDTANIKENEVVVFGWVVFPTKEIRDKANMDVPKDSRMEAIVQPIADIFDASRMIYGGFKQLIKA